MSDHLITGTLTYVIVTCGNLGCQKTWEQPNTPLEDPGWNVCPECLWAAPTNLSGTAREHAADEQTTASVEHPEMACRRCGGPNVSWHAPSPLWNAVMRGGSIDGPWEFDELICPTCFTELAEQRRVAEGWRLTATTVHVELETTTPSGRVWDRQTDLWLDEILAPDPEETT